ncbi:Basic proline-rich protein-like [Balamuthia mandrillaris]
MNDNRKIFLAKVVLLLLANAVAGVVASGSPRSLIQVPLGDPQMDLISEAFVWIPSKDVLWVFPESVSEEPLFLQFDFETHAFSEIIFQDVPANYSFLDASFTVREDTVWVIGGRQEQASPPLTMLPIDEHKDIETRTFGEPKTFPGFETLYGHSALLWDDSIWVHGGIKQTSLAYSSETLRFTPGGSPELEAVMTNSAETIKGTAYHRSFLLDANMYIFEGEESEGVLSSQFFRLSLLNASTSPSEWIEADIPNKILSALFNRSNNNRGKILINGEIGCNSNQCYGAGDQLLFDERALASPKFNQVFEVPGSEYLKLAKMQSLLAALVKDNITGTSHLMELRQKCVWDTGCTFKRNPPGGCPPGRPVLCPSGTCEKWADDCGIVQHQCGSRIPCFGGSCASSCDECIANALPCLPSEVQCCDGSCVSSFSQCYVEQCTPKRPVRCLDGTCAANHNSQKCSQSPGPCPEGTSRCYDGVCRSSCPAPDVCPPLHTLCPDYSCASESEACDTKKGCKADEFRCWNKKCYALTEQDKCVTPPFQRKIIPISISLPANRTNATSIQLVDAESGDELGRLEVGSRTFQQDTLLSVAPGTISNVRYLPAEGRMNGSTLLVSPPIDLLASPPQTHPFDEDVMIEMRLLVPLDMNISKLEFSFVDEETWTWNALPFTQVEELVNEETNSTNTRWVLVRAWTSHFTSFGVLLHLDEDSDDYSEDDGFTDNDGTDVTDGESFDPLPVVVPVVFGVTVLILIIAFVASYYVFKRRQKKAEQAVIATIGGVAFE